VAFFPGFFNYFLKKVKVWETLFLNFQKGILKEGFFREEAFFGDFKGLIF